LDVIGAEPVIITALGSSMWGANRPDLSWLDMERILFEEGIFTFRSLAATIGGRGDRGGNITPLGRDMARDIISKTGTELIEENTLRRSIQKRMDFYTGALPEGRKYAAYVNIGSGLGSIGSLQNLVLLPDGRIKNLPKQEYPVEGTMIKMGLSGVPLINLAEIKTISAKYGIPIASEPMPSIPSGGVFYRDMYNMYAVASVAFIYIALLALVIFFMRRK
jgi:poly-gamma-glutamate system protein